MASVVLLALPNGKTEKIYRKPERVCV